MKRILILCAVLIFGVACGRASDTEKTIAPSAAVTNNDAKAAPAEKKRKSIRLDFSNTVLKKGIPAGWGYRGKIGTPDVTYELLKDNDSGADFLRFHSDRATGVLLYDLKDIDLEKYPVMRWKWRAILLPEGADANIKAKDDQGLALYIGYGKFKQKSVSYTWQTETPKGEKGKAVYNGLVTVYWFGLRDKTDGTGKWYVEERNVRDDMKKEFGVTRLPSGLALSLSANSQYTGTKSVMDLESVEFLEEESGK